METNEKFTEKESLELITNMINSTKKKMEMGSGNTLLCYGYFTAGLSVVIYLLNHLTGHAYGSFGWFLMFVFWGILTYIQRKHPRGLVTYIDKAVSQVWQVIGWMFILTVVILFVFAFTYGKVNFSVMLPLSLIYCAAGISITGVVIRESSATYLPLIGLGLAVYMLSLLVMGESSHNLWNLYFGVAIFVMMAVPGHIMNCKARRVC